MKFRSKESYTLSQKFSAVQSSDLYNVQRGAENQDKSDAPGTKLSQRTKADAILNKIYDLVDAPTIPIDKSIPLDLANWFQSLGQFFFSDI